MNAFCSQVTANDPDMDINGQVTYSLEPAPGGNPAVNDVFSIDGDSGWITVARPVDCEAARLYRFLVVATDHGGDAALSSSVAVEVTVTDENDNAPHFTEDVYRGSTLENRWPSGVIASMTTTDADVSLENRLVTCYITGVWGTLVWVQDLIQLYLYGALHTKCCSSICLTTIVGTNKLITEKCRCAIKIHIQNSNSQQIHTGNVKGS